MIPVQRFAFEKHDCEYGEYHQSDTFLKHFELHQREWAAVTGETYAVGRYLTRILGKSYAP